MVRPRRLELPRGISPQAPQACASTIPPRSHGIDFHNSIQYAFSITDERVSSNGYHTNIFAKKQKSCSLSHRNSMDEKLRSKNI